MKYLIILLLSMSSLLTANETSVYLSMHSYHYDKTMESNESHSVIGGEHNGYFVEKFTNSFYDRTYHAGYIDRGYKCNTYNICLGYSVGLLQGYKKYEPNIIPIILPVVSWKSKHWGVDTLWLYHKSIAIKFRYIF